jgi:hypothetical protein
MMAFFLLVVSSFNILSFLPFYAGCKAEPKKERKNQA